MKRFDWAIVLALWVPLLMGFAAQLSEADMIKADLIGKRMGGREKAWKFQSPEQIKELTINNKSEEAQKKVYEITLKLQDPRVPGVYEAKARVEYLKVDSEWQLKVVGLEEMKKVQ